MPKKGKKGKKAAAEEAARLEAEQKAKEAILMETENAISFDILLSENNFNSRTTTDHQQELTILDQNEGEDEHYLEVDFTKRAADGQNMLISP